MQQAAILNNNLTARFIEKLSDATPTRLSALNSAAKDIINKFVDQKASTASTVNLEKLLAGNGISIRKNIEVEV